MRIHVASAAGTYPVVFSHGLTRDAGPLLRALGNFTGVFVLSSPRVWRHCRRRLLTAPRGLSRSRIILFDDRESAKNLRTVEMLCRRLVRAGADRKALLVAVGGGVVGDVAGFVAASLLRGVQLVHVPTTLVAQVDSAIGGKTGVDLPEGKNLVGAFYPPRSVLVDPELLRTLPRGEFRSGVYEVLKYGIICDALLFRYLEANLDRVLRRDSAALRFVIPRCIQAKARIVSRDEKESGLREVLNFGHTVGHALEVVTRYRRYRHGEAVGWGMMAAARLGVLMGRTPEDHAQRIVRVVQRVGKLPPWPRSSESAILRAMDSDKKTRAGKLRFVLASTIGHGVPGVEVPPAAVRQILWEMLKATGDDGGRP
jgi:3-dehydroquinate synthase